MAPTYLRTTTLALGVTLVTSIARAQAPEPLAPAAPPGAAPTPEAQPATTPPAPAPAEAAPAAASPEPVTPPAAAPEAPSGNEPEEPPAAKPVEPAPPSKLAVGKAGVFQPGLLLQGWFLVDRADETTSTFRLRRAEIHAKGDIVPDLVSYAVMIDPAKVLEQKDANLPVQNQEPPPAAGAAPEQVTAKQPVSATSVLQDFFITFHAPYVDASIGQFKIPVSWEGYNSSSKLLFPERALVSRQFGDKRDLGIRLTKTFKYFGYSAGVFNGAELNNLDTNNGKDAALRLEVYPIEQLTLAGVIYGSIGDRDETAKDRYEGDVRLDTGTFLVQAEYIRGHDVASGAEVDAHGFYAALGYTFFDVLQPVVRVGFLDPNVDENVDPTAAGGKDEVWHFEAGLNYYIQKHEAKLQLAYGRFQFEDKTPNNEVIAAAQVSF